MKLVLAEKPSVAMSLSKVIGANQRGDGYMEGNGYLVSWCVGHLVELSQYATIIIFSIIVFAARREEKRTECDAQ